MKTKQTVLICCATALMCVHIFSTDQIQRHGKVSSICIYDNCSMERSNALWTSSVDKACANSILSNKLVLAAIFQSTCALKNFLIDDIKTSSKLKEKFEILKIEVPEDRFPVFSSIGLSIINLKVQKIPCIVILDPSDATVKYRFSNHLQCEDDIYQTVKQILKTE